MLFLPSLSSEVDGHVLVVTFQPNSALNFSLSLTLTCLPCSLVFLILFVLFSNKPLSTSYNSSIHTDIKLLTASLLFLILFSCIRVKGVWLQIYTTLLRFFSLKKVEKILYTGLRCFKMYICDMIKLGLQLTNILEIEYPIAYAND